MGPFSPSKFGIIFSDDMSLFSIILFFINNFA